MRAASKPVKHHSFIRRFFVDATHLAHFEFFLSGARHRMLHTAYSAPREENPNCTQMRSTYIALKASGFTIIETLIVLAVTAALFLLAFVAVGGKQNETEFQQAINDFQSSMQQIVNQVSSGNYQEANLVCNGVTSPLIISAAAPGTSTEGTNDSCIFLGKVVQFANKSVPQKYFVYQIAGMRRDQSTLLSCTTIDCTNPVLVAKGTAGSTSGYPDNGTQHSLHYGLTIYSVQFDDGTPPKKDVGAFGIMNSLSSAPGAQQFYLVPITNTFITNDPNNASDMQGAVNNVDVKLASSYDSVQGIINSTNSHYDLEICLASGTTNQSGLVTIGGNGGDLNSITTTIYSNKKCL